jgi:hypothetical protein
MFNINWADVFKQLTEKLHENNVKNAVLKMKADIFTMYLAQGSSNDDAWAKAQDAAKFFGEKIGYKP